MTIQILFALILLVSSSQLAILNFLNQDQALKTLAWFNILRDKKAAYNWTKTLHRTRRGASLAGILSIGGLILSLITDLNDNIFLGLVLLIVTLYIYLSYPVKE